MRRAAIARFVLLLASSCAVASAAVAQGNVAECPVRIVLGSGSFQTSYNVKARLESDGPRAIYLPKWMSGGFGIARVEEGSAGGVVPEPTTTDTKADSIYPLQSNLFEFDRPAYIPFGWREVGVHEGESGFAVPAGTYRLRFVFAVVDPRKQPGPLVHLCTIYSAPFRLLADSAWTRTE